MRVAIAALIRLGHSECYQYGWNFFLDCIDEISGKKESKKQDDQDEWLRKMGVLQ